jgi:transaldolase/glucose-6-phosphate isomerase
MASGRVTGGQEPPTSRRPPEAHGDPANAFGSGCVLVARGSVMLDVTPERLGPLAEPARTAQAELADRDAVTRLWAADHTLWRDDPTEVSDRLGWLTVVPEMAVGVEPLRAQCTGLLADGIDHVLLMGMGGSSLFPEVVARSFGSQPGDPVLHVVDTTDPAAIGRLAAQLDPERTLHIAASKSGTTLETRSQLEWAWERHPDPARFAVITDPETELAALARDRGFAAVWENRSDIGGRYSALSHFGIVPGMLTAPDDADQLLRAASSQAERLRAAAPANPGASLAATLAAAVRNGRDKVTLLLPDEVASFGLWLEQLLAESTGKDGTGVVPVVGEPLGDPEVYGDDRLFVALGDGGAPAELDRLAAAGHPVYSVGFAGTDELGGQVLLWEAATALGAALLGIQPFDQPDVAAAKTATNEVLAEGGVADEPTVSLAVLLDQLRPGDYLAIQAFVDPGSPVVEQLEAVRLTLRDRLRVATTLGLGPRFLHSTGQLHKGGPDTGVFVQVVGDADDDVAIPGRPYGFTALERAQAAGDLRTLRQRGRRAGRVDLDQLLEEAR